MNVYKAASRIRLRIPQTYRCEQEFMSACFCLSIFLLRNTEEKLFIQKELDESLICFRTRISWIYFVNPQVLTIFTAWLQMLPWNNNGCALLSWPQRRHAIGRPLRTDDGRHSIISPNQSPQSRFHRSHRHRATLPVLRLCCRIKTIQKVRKRRQ